MKSGSVEFQLTQWHLSFMITDSNGKSETIYLEFLVQNLLESFMTLLKSPLEVFVGTDDV